MKTLLMLPFKIIALPFELLLKILRYLFKVAPYEIRRWWTGKEDDLFS